LQKARTIPLISTSGKLPPPKSGEGSESMGDGTRICLFAAGESNGDQREKCQKILEKS